MRFVSFSILALALTTSAALAADLPANHCELSLSRVGVSPSSHGEMSFVAYAKVGWIGNGETIQSVKFYGRQIAKDLGNDPSQCHWGIDDSGRWKFVDGTISSETQYGEYVFEFQVETGSVVSACPGYEYTWVGTFLVQTNKNTYWLNPDMDSSKYFYFDANGLRSLESKGAFAGTLYTSGREDLRYYNPLNCR